MERTDVDAREYLRRHGLQSVVKSRHLRLNCLIPLKMNNAHTEPHGEPVESHDETSQADPASEADDKFEDIPEDDDDGLKPQRQTSPRRRVPRRRTATAQRGRQRSPAYDPHIFDPPKTAPVAEANGPTPGTQAPPQQANASKRRERPEGKEPLRLRLDLNLDLDVEIRARIHGDVTLALL
jgi:hypothetical protein